MAIRKQVRNLNKHTPAGTQALAESIARDGWIGAVTVAADDETFDGSNRIEVGARAFDNPIVVESDGTRPVVVKRVDIPSAEDPKAKRLGFTANQIQAVDFDPDAALLKELAAQDEVVAQLAKEDERLRALLQEPKTETADAGEMVDKAAELQEKWRVAKGDLFQTSSVSTPGGSHRLLCGDSTSPSDVARLMNGQKATLFCTDPPYGVGYGDLIQEQLNRTKKWERIENDNMEGEDTQKFLESVFLTWRDHLIPNAAWYLWHAQKVQGFFTAAAAAAVIYHRQIVWVKPQMILGRGHFHWRHELCLYGWQKGHEPKMPMPRNATTVWEFARDRQSDYLHPTQKPSECFSYPMGYSTEPGDICAEPFAGSGTQFIAGEQTGRLVYGMELSEKFCAVCLERLSKLGLSPVRL